MITATIFEAKTNLSDLIRKVQAGEEVVITSGREKTPVVKLVMVEAVRKPQRLGAWLTPGFELTDAFWEPMSEQESGYGDDGIL